MPAVGMRLIATAYTPEQFPRPDTLEIVFAGRSNVGKSMLLNQLALGQKRTGGRDRARVSRKPGCTRSVNFYDFWPEARLVDLPGYGYADMPAAGRQSLARLVDAYFSRRRDIAAIVLVLDARLPLQPLDRQMLTWGGHFHYFHLLAMNKCDKLSRSAVAQRRCELASELSEAGFAFEVIPISAATGFGVPDLVRRLREAIHNHSKGVGDDAV